MVSHKLQSPIHNLVDYLSDAHHIHVIARDKTAQLTAARKAAGVKSGSGAPPVEHKSLHRATVVAAIGAWEAFCEDLAITAIPLWANAAVVKGWLPIAGSRGMVQTPNADNVAKMFCLYFQYDPRPDWSILVSADWKEATGSGTGWRGTTTSHVGADAAAALNAVVRVRHGFAHQDKSSRPPMTPGLVGLTPAGKIALHSHHALNAISTILQIAIQTTHGLATSLGLHGAFRWTGPMAAAGWQSLLEGTPAGNAVARQWRGCPWSAPSTAATTT